MSDLGPDHDTENASKQGYATNATEAEAAMGTTPAPQQGASTGTGGNPATSLQDDAVLDPAPLGKGS